MPTYIEKICERHGLTKWRKEKDRLRCIKCASLYMRRQRRNIKEKLLAEVGQECSICGYDKCSAGLEFHHPDKNKEISIGSSLGRIAYAKILAEAKKCVVVCGNCHAEIHYEELEFEEKARGKPINAD